MNKLYLFLLFLSVFFYSLVSQAQVPRKYVVVEIGTGTWCPNCPAAARGADDLVANGQHVAVIENHNGDSYTHSTSNTRNSYYGITGYPTAVFDGGAQVVGGSYGGNMYSSYLAKYNTAIAEMSDFTVDLSYEKTGTTYDVTIVLDEPGSYAGTNLKVRLALTESHIHQNWQGMTELDFVNRAMYPTVNGTAYSGGSETINISFTPNASWNTNECELIAFIQDETTKKVLQADKISLLQPVGTNNVTLMELDAADICGSVTPILKMNNLGTDDITSLSIDYSINSGAETGNVSWTGLIPFNEINYIPLDIPVSNVLENNTIDLDIVEVNGVTDDDPSNNQSNTTFGEAKVQDDDYLKVTIQTDGFGDQTTWTIEDSDNNVVASGGPYGNSTTYHEELTLTTDCYTFILRDSGNDGGGKFILKGTSGTMYYSLGNDYAGIITRDFKMLDLAAVDENAFPEISVYPNPANSILNIKNAEGLDIKLYDFLGRELFSKDNISTQEQINLTKIANGTYFILFTNGDKTNIEKIVVSKK